jgi:formylglycine-generating enzyme required for sulfatase activity
MKFKFQFLLLWLVLMSDAGQAQAQGVRYFRISGPAASQIIAFRADGTLVWSNALTGTNYTIQTSTNLSAGTNWVDYVQLPASNYLNTNLLISFHPPTNMALIPAGSFTMGDSVDGDGSSLPLHSVYVSAFYMDKYDVTYALWKTVYNWAIAHGYSFDSPARGKAANHPVQTVDWYDCVKWCNARSEMEGRVPAYYTTSAQTVVYRTGQVNVDNNSVKWNDGYRLPTEAEWEKAARGGLGGQRFPWGNTISESLANYNGCTNCYSYDLGPNGYNAAFTSGAYPYTSPVGYFAPNGYGLYDIEGNVLQWCWDRNGVYSSVLLADPRGPTTGSNRMWRGGAWYIHAIYCRVAARSFNSPGSTDFDIGFRSVLPFGQ